MSAEPKSNLRLVSLDAYRGFVMLLMASDGLRIAMVAQNRPDSHFWQFLAHQVDHVVWQGCVLWDLIQPSFMFMVGVALPFSLASRIAKSQTFGKIVAHAFWRSIVLVCLGIFLRSVHLPQTKFTFEDVLTQIGLGYTFLVLVAWAKPKIQFVIALLILAAYWMAFALYPLPGPAFDYASVGVPGDWHHLTGFAAHWDKNTNFASNFDQWFMNLFPRKQPFAFNDGGYLTLSFVPSLATMIFGLLAGQLLRTDKSHASKARTLLVTGIAGLAIGALLDATGVCPSVKRIWTPSWAIFSAGWTCLLLASFYTIIDWKGYQRWAFPLVVVGMNSIAMYVMVHLWGHFIRDAYKTHLGMGFLNIFGTTYEPIVEMSLELVTLWFFCLWMYRRKLYLKI